MHISRLSKFLVLVAFTSSLYAQTPNPYRNVGWAKLPDGRTWGAVADLDVAPDGEHIWADVRCDATAPERFGNECVDSNLDSILKFNSNGEVVESFGGGMFIWPHGIDVDSEGNVYVTDGVSDNSIPDGDQRERIFVGDRSNNRLQLFDQDGNYINSWTQFGRPSGIFFDEHDRIYVADSESDVEQNPGWKMGIRIGDANLGWVHEFVLYAPGDPFVIMGTGAEFVTVDATGNMYSGEPVPRNLQKYRRVRP
ncbi:MAG: SBBP repeat-containing protein [Proteobacteria bacterium]|nr:SBBP repeat-containing protein [Pseudomonadota bacterium]